MTGTEPSDTDAGNWQNWWRYSTIIFQVKIDNIARNCKLELQAVVAI
jgi:hypothetical protein